MSALSPRLTADARLRTQVPADSSQDEYTADGDEDLSLEATLNLLSEQKRSRREAGARRRGEGAPRCSTAERWKAATSQKDGQGWASLARALLYTCTSAPLSQRGPP